jgi:FAD/FMN-containing dehydrogenase
VLTELSDSREGDALRDELEHTLSAAMELDLVTDAVIAGNQAQAQSLWRIRESIPDASRAEPGMLYRHDIAVAVSRVPAFIGEAQAALKQRFPGVDIICFGHLGDGNLHYNAFIAGRNRDDVAARDAHDVTEVVYDLVQRYQGSFSAEHGIGLFKVDDLKRYKSAVEVELMRTLKRALDPHNLMNPGKVL